MGLIAVASGLGAALVVATIAGIGFLCYYKRAIVRIEQQALDFSQHPVDRQPGVAGLQGGTKASTGPFSTTAGVASPPAWSPAVIRKSRHPMMASESTKLPTPAALPPPNILDERSGRRDVRRV